MSTGVRALDKRDQADVRRWLELQELARQARPGLPWPVLIAAMHVLTFLAGLACGRLLS